MDSNDIFSELIYVGDKQNTTIDLVKKNADVLEAIKEKVSVQPEPPVVVVPDTVVIENFPETQKVEVINHEKVDLTSVEELLSKLVEIVPSIKDDKPAEAIDKLSKLLSDDQTDKKILELLRAILDKKVPEFPEQVPFEIPENLISKEGRIKVEVDRAGGGGSSTLVDIEGERINPATATKQDEIISLETTLLTLVGTLQELTARLSTLASMANSGAPALRVIPIASVSTAVTGAVTVASTSITNFGTGIPASEMAHDMNNMTAVLANINNVSITA